MASFNTSMGQMTDMPQQKEKQRFEQLSSSIAWQVMMVQSEGKKVVHKGLKCKSTRRRRC